MSNFKNHNKYTRKRKSIKTKKGGKKNKTTRKKKGGTGLELPKLEQPYEQINKQKINISPTSIIEAQSPPTPSSKSASQKTPLTLDNKPLTHDELKKQFDREKEYINNKRYDENEKKGNILRYDYKSYPAPKQNYDAINQQFIKTDIKESEERDKGGLSFGGKKRRKKTRKSKKSKRKSRKGRKSRK